MAYRPAAEVLVGCVRMPRFAIQVERWRFPELAELPLGRTGAAGSARGPARGLGGPVGVACSREAGGEGIRVGMPLREARAAAPDAVLRTADPSLYEQQLLQAAAELETVTPLV